MKYKTLWAAALMMLTMAATLSAAPVEVSGRITNITTKTLTINQRTYALMRGDQSDLKVSAGTTQCWVGQVRLTCGTLAAVGHVDHARVVVDDSTVQRIDVLHLLQ